MKSNMTAAKNTVEPIAGGTLMRGFLAILSIIALLLFVGCGGKRQAAIQDDSTTTAESGRTGGPITNTEDVTTESGRRVGSEGISETPLSDMTLEEINAAEFLKIINFDFDKYDLRPDAIALLEQNGRWLLQNGSVKVIIEGHCDERGTEEYNLALGERRANSAKSFLVRFGIDETRLTTVSYGESLPVDATHNESAWAKNRRAFFRVFER